jgi:hypothetical protein
MPLAGRMKLRTFVILVGLGVGLLALGVVGAGVVWGVPALEAQAERSRLIVERQLQETEARREKETRIRAARNRATEERRRAAEESRRAQERDRTPEVEVVPVDGPTGGVADAIMLRYLGKPLGTSKRKDVSQGAGYKVNVYQDDGESAANRAKVDLDRDDKWDEKWSWADGSFSRKVSPSDDENYTVQQVWTNGAWVTR